MKRTFTYISIILLSLGCKGDTSNKTKFEKHLSSTDFLILEKMINSFNLLINNKYKGEIGVFLNDVLIEKPILNKNDSLDNCQLIVDFENSTLEFKSEKLLYDTVYASNYLKFEDEEFTYEEPIIITITQQQDTSWEDIMVPGEQTIENKIKYAEERGYWNLISESSFVNALIQLESNNKEIMGYIKRRRAVGYINPSVMAKGIIESNIDCENYFIKRIIVFEMYRDLIKREHGC